MVLRSSSMESRELGSTSVLNDSLNDMEGCERSNKGPDPLYGRRSDMKLK